MLTLTQISNGNQGWQDGTVRSEFAYYVPRILNCAVPAYRTSVQFLKQTVPSYTVPVPLQNGAWYQRTVLLSKN